MIIHIHFAEKNWLCIESDWITWWITSGPMPLEETESFLYELGRLGIS